MTHIQTQHGVELAYESMGDESAPPVILIMGLGAQMHVWPTTLCYRLVNAGYRVIRFDNRDVGHSSNFNEHGNPSLIRVWLGRRFKRKPRVPYTLKDMSRDVIALMDELGLDSAHLVGASMGGMIAQILAAKKRKRVRSLTSIMSSATAPRVPVNQLQVLLQLARRPAASNRDDHIQYITRMNRIIGSPGFPMSDDELQRLAETSWERTTSPLGFKRQLVAITHAGDRRRFLQKIKARTLIIHGADDPLIPVNMGIETASLIPKAKLKVVLGMGHDFPEALVPRLSKMLIKHLDKANEQWQTKKHVRKKTHPLSESILGDAANELVNQTSYDESKETDPLAWLNESK
jgi:pimeloyl-ACP methyl ester carboxylesterase